MLGRRHSRSVMAGLAAFLFGMGILSRGNEPPELPSFGKDTVLVWNTRIGEAESAFVVRIAEFSPDRYIEWETGSLQGTVFLSKKAVETSRSFISSRLFEGGVESRSQDGTTLWLSRRTFQELKEKGRAKVVLDGVDSWMKVEEAAQLQVEVNGRAQHVPVVRIRDDRGSERWFIDSADNPLMVKHSFRNYAQVLASITTNRRDTLRWIKGKKQKPH